MSHNLLPVCLYYMRNDFWKHAFLGNIDIGQCVTFLLFQAVSHNFPLVFSFLHMTKVWDNAFYGNMFQFLMIQTYVGSLDIQEILNIRIVGVYFGSKRYIIYCNLKLMVIYLIFIGKIIKYILLPCYLMMINKAIFFCFVWFLLYWNRLRIHPNYIISETAL